MDFISEMNDCLTMLYSILIEQKKTNKLLFELISTAKETKNKQI